MTGRHTIPFLTMLLSNTAIVGIALFAASVPAYALPTGGQVAGGAAVVGGDTAAMTVTQSTNRAIIDWQSFDISRGEQVNFVQPSTSAVTLNRVTGSASPSQILGTLTANGTVMLVNPSGVVFGPGAEVNVGSLLATTSDIRNDRFLAGDDRFDAPGRPDAAVLNQGTLTVADKGLAAFVAPNVSNSGVITARLGKVQLASGDAFTLDLYGDGLINLQAGPAITQQIVDNSGLIRAEGGTVTLTTGAAEDTINSLINMDGAIDARSVGDQTGTITLFAEGSNAVAGNVTANKGKKAGASTVLVSGTLDATGGGAGETGGSVVVAGDHVGILTGASINASGDAGGGTIQVGGDFHGQGDTPTALATVVQTGANLYANALSSGNGGTVAVWSDNYTNFAGRIEARGGALSGNGGEVETSGKIILDMSGSVDAKASEGNAGTWLLDPDNLIINAAATTNAGSSPNWTAAAGGGNVLNTNINTALNGGTNVNLAASGSIEVAANISKTAGADATLTLAAGTDIIVDTNIAISSTTGKLNVILDADADASGAGAIVMNSGSSITSNGGNITMGGGNGAITGVVLNLDGSVNTAAQGFASGDIANIWGIYLTNTSINAGGGNIVMNGFTNYSNINNGFDYALYLNGGTVQTVGTGAISLAGISAANAGNFIAQGLIIGGTTLSSADGNISLYGNAGSGSLASLGLNIFGTIQTTGIGANAGNIIINGSAGSGSVYSEAIILQTSGTAASLLTADGNITLNATNNTNGNLHGVTSFSGINTIKSTGAGNIAITTNAAGGIVDLGGATLNIGTTSATGNITLTSDALNFAGTTATQTTGTVTFSPYTPSTSIGIAGAAGTLSLDSALLDTITAGSITVGRSDGTGALTANAYNWGAPATLLTGSGGIAINGAQNMGARSFRANTASGNITLGANGSITSSAAGRAIFLASGGDFINNNGSGALSAPIGRWLVYTRNPASFAIGSLAPLITSADYEYHPQIYESAHTAYLLPVLTAAAGVPSVESDFLTFETSEDSPNAGARVFIPK